MAKLVHNVQKKQHRERSQPGDRKKWGLLEKKKDYKLRAADYHKKQASLKILKEKASARNPDEYYHGMTSRRTDDKGILISDRGNESLSNDEVQLLKTQDANYMNMIRTKELNKIKKQREQIVLGATGKHTVFVENQQEKLDFDPAEFFHTTDEMLQKRENRLRLDQLVDTDAKRTKDYHEVMGKYDKELFDSKKLKKLSNLKQKLEREAKFKNIYDKMSLQKELMKKGDKKKVVDSSSKTTFKWKTVRKR